MLERVEPDAQLTLEVRRSNAGAITLYESFGFRSAGVRRRYYADNGEDAIVMWRTPGDAPRHPRRRSRHMILALETSCDDTCAAVVTRAGEIRSNIVSSQAVHGRFGGVVPEWASRHHLENVNAIVDLALQEAGASLDDAELIAVTQGPGLVGALLIGVATAKGLAASRRLPLAAVDHLQGHVAANFLEEGMEPPFICLLASGGHTLLVRVERHARLRDAGPDARRRRRARRSTRARGCSGSATRAGRRCRSWRWTATRRRSPSRPARASRGWTSRSRA